MSWLSTVRVVAVPSRQKRQAALMEAVAVGETSGGHLRWAAPSAGLGLVLAAILSHLISICGVGIRRWGMWGFYLAVIRAICNLAGRKPLLSQQQRSEGCCSSDAGRLTCRPAAGLRAPNVGTAMGSSSPDLCASSLPPPPTAQLGKTTY